MATKIITPEQGVTRKVSDSYSILNLLTGENSENMSLAIGAANNHLETTKTTSDRAYYILEGELVIDNKLAKKGDVVFIPANTAYTFKGTFKAVLVNAPPFRKNNEA